MRDEAAFLAAVRAAPNDVSYRLVYANWLEERGDPRGELIRVEEEMRQLPVFSDQYWDLKTRRNKLRSQAAPKWLEALRYGTDYDPVFRHGMPAGWKERWRLVREFTERWFGIPMGDVGAQVIETPRSKPRERLGRDPQTGAAIKVREFPPAEWINSLPPSVREWFVFIHELRQHKRIKPALQGSHEFVSAPEETVPLMYLSEPSLYYEIRNESLQDPDPTVTWGDAEYPGSGGLIPHLSSMAFQYIVQSSYGVIAGGFNARVTSTERLIGQLDETFSVRLKLDDVEVFERHNMVALLWGDPFSGVSHCYLRVGACKPMPRGEIPDFLLEISDGNIDTYGWGIFKPAPRG
jgi:uncharacterized protein (TIGR02996 family)